MIYKVIVDKKTFRISGKINDICDLLKIISIDHVYVKSYIDSHFI